MVDNFVFEIDNHGAVLNTDRAYYLTRSQTRFLSSMGRAVHEAQEAAGQNDWARIETAYDYVKRDHEIWPAALVFPGITNLVKVRRRRRCRMKTTFFCILPSPAYENEETIV